jgi:hydroxyacyl-ACP dehydratase HTD2-like protein with hotdog domain
MTSSHPNPAARSDFADISIGDHIAELVVSFDTVQLFFFSAATYNAHRIHYDHAWATQIEGHADTVVHGPLQVAVIARVLTDWIGPRGRLVELSVQHRASVHIGETVRVCGTVTHKRVAEDATTLKLDISAERGDPAIVVIHGTAKVAQATAAWASGSVSAATSRPFSQ